MPYAALPNLRSDIPNNWVINNPILNEDEPGVEINDTVLRVKIGDGTTRWNDLIYLLPTDPIVVDLIAQISVNLQTHVQTIAALQTSYPNPQLGWIVFVVLENRFVMFFNGNWTSVLNSAGFLTTLIPLASNANPTHLSLGSTTAAGTRSSFAREDHQHGMPGVDELIDILNNQGFGLAARYG